MKPRLIGYSELPDAAPLLLASNALPVKALRLEPAGHSFHAAALRLLGLSDRRKPEEDDEEEESKGSGSSSSGGGYSSSYKVKKAAAAQQDHYALLGLGHLRFLATEEQIRKAYREVALKHHPDKQAASILSEDSEEAREAKKQEIDSHFKAIQEAYEILVDPVKRRAYDSVDEFDDEIPGECSGEEFYKVYGPVFARNGRWSVTQPVPDLGDESSPMDLVDGFYNFWYSFKSWREFPHADEFDTEQAEGREHKRWMERQNLKLRERAKKEESARVRTLVENAYKRDPRIVRRREEEKAEKVKKKEARLQARREREMEAARAAEEERMRREAEERRSAEEAAAVKKLKEKEKRAIRKERSRLRGLSAPAKARGLVSDDGIESLCSSLDLERLRGLCEKLELAASAGQAEELARLLSEEIGGKPGAENSSKPQDHQPHQPEQQQQRGEEEKKSATPRQAPGVEEEKKERPWSQAEVELLRKAMVKYPKGTSQRWEVVSEYIGSGRSVEEILRAIKTVLLQKPDSSRAFDTFLQKRKPVNEISSPLSTRLEEAGEVLAPEKRKSSDGNPGVLENGGAKKSEDSSPGAAAAATATGAGGKGVSETTTSATTTATGGGKGVDSTTAAGAGAGGEGEEAWSEVQELALVKALKAFPKETAQRWERIAAAVPGKSKAQCFKKFTALRENFRAKK